MFYRQDPGPCIVCGADHSTCTAEKPGPITVTQLPARDEATSAARLGTVSRPPESSAPAPVSSFSTSEYRGRDESTGQPIVDKKGTRKSR